jgi:hypothetical protein
VRGTLIVILAVVGGLLDPSLAHSAGSIVSASVMEAVTSELDSGAVASAPALRLNPPEPANAAESASCPPSGHAAIVDRATQSGWLCTDGSATERFPITTAISQPSVGTYHVYAKDRLTTSTFGGHFSYLDNFVAFTRGQRGFRIGFHAVPRDGNGNPFQPYDAVGTPEWHGQSSGCIRVLPDQSTVIWDHLKIGDVVKVIS